MEKQVLNNSIQISGRRKLVADQDAVYKSWAERIMTSLIPKDNGDYGHISKDCMFFRIKTITSVKVPQDVISRMEKENKIKLGNDGYYFAVK